MTPEYLEKQYADEFAQCLVAAMMNGCDPGEAAEVLVREFVHGSDWRKPPRAAKLYTPRNDPSLATPRLSEREWLSLRWSVLERDGHACTYCGDTEPMCVDHVVPLSRGGTNDPDNLVACCIPCNSSKSDRLLSEWRGRYQ